MVAAMERGNKPEEQRRLKWNTMVERQRGRLRKGLHIWHDERRTGEERILRTFTFIAMARA